jgi:hypothetical protein
LGDVTPSLARPSEYLRACHLPAIEAESYLLSCGPYIERNPVDAWDYRWSSCRAYACDQADLLLTANPW